MRLGAGPRPRNPAREPCDRRQRQRDDQDRGQPGLAQPLAEVRLGQEAQLQQEVVNGLSRVRLGDSVWPVRCSQPLPAGAAVRVIAVDGITLIVEAL